MYQETQAAQNVLVPPGDSALAQPPLAECWTGLIKIRGGTRVYRPIPPDKLTLARFIGLDVHKHYLIAFGVDAQLNHLLGPRRVQLAYLENWAQKTLRPYDAVVLEMTTNAFQLYDDLLPYAYSVTLVHPPHVTLITRLR